ncbi:MAG: hypothetical protein A2Z29_00695 [Chloroflexi bacterium RBG_16_56_11]|nr:MAG: hypothetical protein A2Z29_00695 [Chloroflexi bacterium RBG_16_56_11]
MQKTPIPISKWDGQLPSHIAENEQIWWEVMPNIKTKMPSKLFGGVKESPSTRTVGKIILVSETRTELRTTFGAIGGSLLNHWGCYCNQMIDELNTVYMAGEAEKPFITFNVSPGALSTLVLLNYYEIIEEELSAKNTLQNAKESMMITFIQLGGKEIQLKETTISIASFKHGSWENGLDITFKAAVWVCSNRKEALTNIWQIPV